LVLDQPEATLNVVFVERQGALAVPVTARVDVRPGELAVIVPARTRTLVIRPGTAAGGDVEIVGGVLAAGADVLLPTRNASP